MNSCVLGMYRSVEWCVQTLSLLGAGSAALVGDSGGHAPFLVFLTHSIYSAAGQRG